MPGFYELIRGSLTCNPVTGCQYIEMHRVSRACIVHDRDCIFSSQFDRSITHRGLRSLRTPCRSTKANSLCERVIGALRLECLDFLTPLTENHLRIILKNWLTQYNQGRPHSSIGPGIPDPPASLPVTRQEHRRRIPDHLEVVDHPVPGGSHQDEHAAFQGRCPVAGAGP